jgi:hypothetical protein
MKHCMLDSHTDYLLSSTVVSLLRLLDDSLSHDYIARWWSIAEWGSANIWQAPSLIRQIRRFAVLIMDDSMLGKAYVDANELTCTHRDHSHQHHVKGLNFVSLLDQTGELACEMVSVRQAKTSQSPFTKNKCLEQMLRVFQQQVTCRYLLVYS